MQEPVITVGILSGKEIGFSFPKEFISSDGIAICGIQQAVYRKGKICWQEKEYDELSFTPQQDTSSFFELQDVTIGINFHWERKEVQRFKGELKIIVEDDRLTAINIIPIEININIKIIINPINTGFLLMKFFCVFPHAKHLSLVISNFSPQYLHTLLFFI